MLYDAVCCPCEEPIEPEMNEPSFANAADEIEEIAIVLIAKTEERERERVHFYGN